MNASYAKSSIHIAHGATLEWVNTNTNDISSRINIPENATANLDVGTNHVTFNSAPTVASGGSIVKKGPGNLTFASPVNSPTLNVYVSTGQLTVNGALGNIDVSSSAKFGGSGTVDVATIYSGGIIAPGTSPGTLSAASLVLMGGSVFEWELRNANGVAGVGFDTFHLTGSLDLRGASDVNKITLKLISLDGTGLIGNPLNFNPNSNYSFMFGTAGGLQLSAGLNITDVFAFDTSQLTYTNGDISSSALWSISYNALDGMITLTAVPEPSTYALGIGVLALAAAAIRRRRQKKHL